MFFFFQAEDGIRDIGVTGVQTCALPILGSRSRSPGRGTAPFGAHAAAACRSVGDVLWGRPVARQVLARRRRFEASGRQTGSVEGTTEAQKSVILTNGAAAKAKALLDKEGRDDPRLRIAGQPGGCSGLRY